MARRKGRKEWNIITEKGWMSILGNTEVISDLMMQIFFSLYRSPNYTDNAKQIAHKLHTEYRALNAAVGWAGNKIKNLCKEKKIETCSTTEKASLKMAPWEYVFNGKEDEDGTYLWILKENAVRAFRELEESGYINYIGLEEILSEDISSFGVEGNLFSQTSETTVKNIKEYIESERKFERKSLTENSQCTVCGIKRLSLLRMESYGKSDKKHKGLCFCPTHAALFSAHLISFDKDGKLIISDKIDEEERKILKIENGMPAKMPFSNRRMQLHRKKFNQESRETK